MMHQKSILFLILLFCFGCNQPTESKNIYGCTKRNSETLIENHSRDYYIIRLPAMFGNRQNKNSGYFDKIYTWLESPQDEYNLTSDKFETPTYNYDVAVELLNILKKEYSNGYYHICNDGRASLFDIVEELSRKINLGLF